MQERSLPIAGLSQPPWHGRARTLAAVLCTGLLATMPPLPGNAAAPVAASQTPQATRAAVDAIIFSRQDVKAGLAAGTIILLDVREPDEFAAGHIAGARLTPLSAFNVAVLPREPGKQVVLYCQSGRRALIAHSLATGAGRNDLAVYSGSMLDWRGAGEPVDWQ